MLPGFFLTFLYLIYILGWAIINPKIAPKLSPDQYRVDVPDYLRALERRPGGSIVPGLLASVARPGGGHYRAILQSALVASVPVLLTVGTLGATWWYVVIYNAPGVTAVAPAAAAKVAAPLATPTARTAVASAPGEEKPQELGMAGEDEKPEELGTAGDSTDGAKAAKAEGPPEEMTSLRDPSTEA